MFAIVIYQCHINITTTGTNQARIENLRDKTEDDNCIDVELTKCRLKANDARTRVREKENNPENSVMFAISILLHRRQQWNLS